MTSMRVRRWMASPDSLNRKAHPKSKLRLPASICRHPSDAARPRPPGQATKQTEAGRCIHVRVAARDCGCFTDRRVSSCNSAPFALLRERSFLRLSRKTTGRFRVRFEDGRCRRIITDDEQTPRAPLGHPSGRGHGARGRCRGANGDLRAPDRIEYHIIYNIIQYNRG